ncbi:DUF4238 domain-containing protein [Rothia mucilaginosa]
MNEKDHLIPACVIGQFTNEKEGNKWREQKVYKRDIRNNNGGFVRAKDIGWARGEYNSEFSIDVYGNESGLDQNDNSRDAIALDKDFQKVESKLPEFIEKLENGEGVLDSDYKNILIPYIAQLFVRSKMVGDYIAKSANKKIKVSGNKRRTIPVENMPQNIPVIDSSFKSGISDVQNVIYDPKNTVQYNRKKWLKEYEEYDLCFYAIDILLDNKRRFVLSNLGLAPLPSNIDPYRRDESMGEESGYYLDFDYNDGGSATTAPAYLVPLSPKIVIKITPRYVVPSVYKRKFPVRYVDITDSRVDKKPLASFFNDYTVKYATEFYVGRNKNVVDKHRRVKQYADEKIKNDLNFLSRVRDENYIEDEGRKKDYFDKLKKKIDSIKNDDNSADLIDVKWYLKPARKNVKKVYCCEPLLIPENSTIKYVPNVYENINKKS